MLERYDPHNWGITPKALIDVGITLALAVLLALLIHWIAFATLRRIARLSSNKLDDVVVKEVHIPARWAFIGIAIAVAANSDALIGDGWDIAANYLTPALIGWVAYALVDGIANGLDVATQNARDPVAMRAQRTRVAILGRTAKVAILIITISLIMLNVPGVRDIGVTMMASAGLAALAVGAAAQPALKSLIAGMQMALTQPLRIGDMVRVDDQVGRVEEIRMSFVTVRTWDERVLVVPTSRFLDQSFENWSRVSEKLTGPVFLHLDPATDVAPIRTEFERFVHTREDWDQRTASMLMTEARPESIELRISVSAATIGDLWTLRCAVREHMIDWLRREMPNALIRRRLEVEAANARALS